MAKTIIIGLGTTGLSIVNHIQKFYYEFTGKDKPDNVEYMFCETAIHEQADKTPNKKESSIRKIELSLRKSGDFIRNYQNVPKWFPSAVEADALGEDGANGVSKYGRLGLWKNWSTVKNAIETAHRGGGNDDTVYILGSFMGGTCTGTFIDMAYLAQKVTQSDKIFGFFLIPPANEDNKTTVYSSYLNAISSLKYYQKGSTNIAESLYQTSWPEDGPQSFATKPYKHVFLLSREYQDYAKTDNNNVIQTAALHICARLMDNAKLHNTIFTKLTDVYNKADFNYSTIGSMMISYPLSQLQQIAGLQACGEMIADWNNEEEFFNTKVQAKTKIVLEIKEIIRKYHQKFEEILLQAMNCQDETKLFKKIENDVRSSIDDKNVQKLWGLFRIDTADNYYADVCDCKNSMQEHFIDHFYELCVDVMREYKNINILSAVLKSFADEEITCGNNKFTNGFIGQSAREGKGILNFWFKQYRLTEDKNDYSKAVNKYLAEALNKVNVFRLLGQRETYLIEVCKNALMFCKMHIFITILKDIRKAIVQSQHMMGARNRLITLTDIENIKKVLAHLVDPKKIENNIPSRINQIKSSIQQDDNNFHFRYLFYNNLDEDIDEINRQKTKEPELYTGDLLPYLIQTERVSDLFSDCLDASRNMFEDNQTTQKTINEIVDRTRKNDAAFAKIKSYFDSEMEYQAEIKKQVPALLKLHKTDFYNEANLQLVYCMANFSGSPTLIGNANSYLARIGDPTTNSSIKNGVVLSDLRNMAIIISQQYSKKDNDKWIDIIEDIDLNYNYYAKVELETLKDSNPYLSEDQIRTILQPLKTIA